MIFAILRRDLDDRARADAHRTGPAVRSTPRVSPDGKTLAFIRRVRLEERALRPAISRPAPSVPSSTASTRICRKLVDSWRLSAVRLDARQPRHRDLGAGKLWRVDVAASEGNGAPIAIPRARSKQTVTEAVRFSPKCPRRAFRRAHAALASRISPDGTERRVYSALGKHLDRDARRQRAADG